MSDPNTPTDDAQNAQTPGATPPQDAQPATPYSPAQTPAAPQGAPVPPPAGTPAPPQPQVQPGAPIPPQQQFQTGAPVPPQGYGYGAPAPQPKGLAITALILGLVALVGGLIFSWIPFVGGVITILIGAAAVVLGILALKKAQSKGMSLTGLITGGIAVLVGAGSIIAWAAFFSAVDSTLDEYGTSFEDFSSEFEDFDDFDSEFGTTEELDTDSNAASGDYSAEFCAALDNVSSLGVNASATELSPELVDAYRQLAAIDSPNQAVYEGLLKFVENPLDASASEQEFGDYMDALMTDAMACM